MSADPRLRRNYGSKADRSKESRKIDTHFNNIYFLHYIHFIFQKKMSTDFTLSQETLKGLSHILKTVILRHCQ